MIVVTGATGNVGRVLVQALTAAGEQVRGVSRGTVPISLPDGVPHHHADLSDPETLRPAVRGASAMFLMVSGAGAHVNAADLLGVARAGGIERVVLLSSQAAATRPQSRSHAPLRTIEEAVRDSGLEWTILRPGGFASNAYAWAESVRARRAVLSPYGDIGLPVVDPGDIAEVAAVILRERRQGGQVYQLTGPALTTPRQRAEAIGAALGETVLFVEQRPQEARAQMLTFMPAEVVDGTLDIIGRPTAEEQQISPDVERILGRAPRSFADWARDHVQAFK